MYIIHDTTKIAMEQIDDTLGLNALEIGCGSGQETIELERLGFQVVAVDIKPSDICSNAQDNITFVEKNICDFEFGFYDLVLANLVLPFVPIEKFNKLWLAVCHSVRPNGIIAGHFFGKNDWKVHEGHVWGAEEDWVKKNLLDFDILHFLENKIDGQNLKGQIVHKHNYEFVALKNKSISCK